MARPKIPDYVKTQRKLQTEHLKELSKPFNRTKLTKWAYHNGMVELPRFCRNYRWTPKRKDEANAGR